MAIKVECEIECLEVDGKEPGLSTHPKPSVKLRSHWNTSSRVVLVVENKTYTFDRFELAAAITNAGNRGAVT
jgi:hypothetical protein